MLEVQHSRTTPIRDSKEAVPGYPVQIYLIPASRHYQACTVGRMNGTRPRTSLKTGSRATALRAAKEWYNGLLLKLAKGETLVESADFCKIAEEMFVIDEARTKRVKKDGRPAYSVATLKNDRSIYKSALKPFFERMNCKNITSKALEKYAIHLRSRKDHDGNIRTVSDKTLKNHLTVLSKILSRAARDGVIAAKPELPILDLDRSETRGYLEESQYVLVLDTIDDMIENKFRVKEKNAGMVTKELRLLTQFLMCAPVRPGKELVYLKHKDVKREISPGGKSYLLIDIVQGKNGRRESTSEEEAIHVYSEICRYHHPAQNSNSYQGEYIFFPGHNRPDPTIKTVSRAGEIMSAQFSAVMKKAGLYIDPAGQERTLYSLRHSLMMKMLLRGDDINNVAINNGTSIPMINKHYGSHLTAKMMVDTFGAKKNVSAELGSTLEHLFEEEETA